MDILKTVLTTLLSAVALFIIAKITGHKQMAQLELFDYINGITIGSIAAELATELENPLRPLVAMTVYGIIALVLGIISGKFPATRKVIIGSPIIIMDKGKLFKDNMKKAKLDLNEFTVMCRQAGYFNLSDIQTAVFEYNGRLSLLPKSNKRPATPFDFNLTPAEEYIGTTAIMDGKIMHKNLSSLGVSESRLKRDIAKQGYKSVSDIFLAIYNGKDCLTVFESD